MSELVLDSSVAVKWFVNEPDSDKAKLVLDQYLNGSVEFCVPDLFYSEVGNIFWKKVSHQGLNEKDASDSLKEIKQISFKVSSTISLFDKAFRIAITDKRTFYDSLYIALSDELGCEFITADERLFNSVKSKFPSIKLLSNIT